jgi:pilus assembly protein Flp/PilA
MERFFINFVNILSEVRESERGAAGVEYGILVAAIAAVIVALAFLIGGEIKNAFQTVYDELV